MALVLKEKPEFINGSTAMEEIDFPEMDAAFLMSLLEESQCTEECCNEEQVNSLMESLEAEIRMAGAGSCSIEQDIESNDYFVWDEMEMAASSPSDDMNWYVEDHVEQMSMDSYLIQFENDFHTNCHEIQLENGVTSLWQETYDTAIYN